MGAHKSRLHKIHIEDNQKLEPEPDYLIKTRSPRPSRWQLNILRGKKEDDLRNEAYPLARRKCHKSVEVFMDCEKENGLFWTSFNCQEEYESMSQCFEHELFCPKEMDKLRRDMKRHSEWWWKCLYDENGEIGEQKEWNGEWWMITLLRNGKNHIYDFIYPNHSN